MISKRRIMVGLAATHVGSAGAISRGVLENSWARVRRSWRRNRDKDVAVQPSPMCHIQSVVIEEFASLCPV
jgi:hypothetical protein